MTTFKAVKPQIRSERNSFGNKDRFEKQRLKNRQEGFRRYEDIGPVVEAAEGTLSFASNFERYQTDASVGLKLERDAVAQHREIKYDTRRQLHLTRENERWKQADNEDAAKQERLRQLSEGSKGSVNHSGVAYDPITLQYYPTAQGAQQRYLDELARYRSGVRAERLHRAGAGSGFNPVTGEELRPPPVPGKPAHSVAAVANSTRPW